MNIDLALEAAQAASNVIMHIYETDFAVEYKEDASPVTMADQQAHKVICQVLSQSDYPIVSEESKQRQHHAADIFWLVDPLDGTKEFIQKNGEFTVNIALIHQQRPVLGVVAVPAQDVVYFAEQGKGAFKRTLSSDERLHCSQQVDLHQATIAVSRSHLREQDQTFIQQHAIKHVKPLGSALKYCQLAEGLVDLSVRYTPLMQWDLAASDCIVHEAGGSVCDFALQPYHYDATQAEQALLQGLVTINAAINFTQLTFK